MIIRFGLAAVLLMPAVAMAQGNPGPYGGLFGRAPARAGRDRTVVEVRSSIGAQYNSAILPEETSAILPEEGVTQTATQHGVGAGASASVIFQHETDKFTALVDGSASRTQLFVTPAYGASLFSGSALISSEITSRIHGDISASYVHSPFYQVYPNFGLNSTVSNGGGPIPAFAPYATQMLENETVQATAGLSAALTERTKLSASVSRRQTLFTQSDADFAVNGYQARWTWNLRRDLGVHAGYGLEHSTQAGEGGQEYDNETIDVGVDFTRSFSVARRTALSFSTSTSLVKTGNSSREVRLNGGVILAKQFRRTWRAAANATRATSFVPGFYEPIYTDTVGVSLGGLLSRRLEVGVNADAGKGASAISKASGFNTVSASARLTTALNRFLGLYGQYSAYRYDIPQNSNALRLADHLARQSVSVGVTAYVPVYKKMGQ